MSSIKELNDIMEQSRLKKKEAGLNTKTIRLKQSQWEAGKSNKGRKHSEETRKKWSDIRKGKKPSAETIAKTTIGQKKTKWLQLLEKYPEDILRTAIEKCGNHQNNICDELKCGIQTIRKLCKHYEIEVPKKSSYEKQDWAKKEQSEPILVWKCSKKQPYKKIGKPKEYYSVRFCCNSFEPKLHKGNMLRNMKNGTPYRNMYFEKK